MPEHCSILENIVMIAGTFYALTKLFPTNYSNKKNNKKNRNNKQLTKRKRHVCPVVYTENVHVYTNSSSNDVDHWDRGCENEHKNLIERIDDVPATKADTKLLAETMDTTEIPKCTG
jgi:hypothetical protein